MKANLVETNQRHKEALRIADEHNLYLLRQDLRGEYDNLMNQYKNEEFRLK